MDRTDQGVKEDLAVLGLPITANRAEVTKAYRRLARVNHPDVSSAPDAARRFEVIENAYRHALDTVPVHTRKLSAPSFEFPPQDQISPICVELRCVHAVARPVIVVGPVRIEPPPPRKEPLTTNGHGATHG